MKKYLMLLLLLVLLLISGCLPKQQSQNPEDFAFPEVSFSISNTEVRIGEPILFDAFVSIEGEPIKDADRVEFEIWHESQEEGEHESILIEHAGDGHYTLEKSFDKAGTYYIYYHVDAIGLHLMEKFDFTVK